MTIDIDDVNKLAHQLRTKDPQAEVTRHHMNRLHGVQTVNTQLERNHERFERQLRKAKNFVRNYRPIGLPLTINYGGVPKNLSEGLPKRRTIYAQ